MSHSYIACMPLLHALCYTLAVLGVCWLRCPAIAGFGAVFHFVLATFAFEAIPGLAQFEPVSVYNALYFDERPAPNLVKIGEDAPRHCQALAIVFLRGRLLDKNQRRF
jgi:hypothetical protein